MENAQSLPAMIMLKMDWSLMQIAAETAENALMAKAAMQTQIAPLTRVLMEYAWKRMHAVTEF
mgnify:CR=1 FL=1